MSHNPTVGIIILAAGASRRFGGQAKQLLTLDGKSLIRRIVETAIAAQVGESIIVVLGANQTPIQVELTGLSVQLIDNPHWAEGMSTSLRAGLTTLMRNYPDLDAVVVLLCDQPLITPALIRQLVVVYTETGKPLVACRYTGGVGVPALFARPVFADLLALNGDKGARYLLLQRPDDRAVVDFAPAAVDLDSWADVAKWENEQKGNRFS